ncbi:MAG TPA: hypothetical protein VGN54_00760 [Mycobacteriales bacterium]|jgi:hypothetical protein|nr:hypothetical protein [Mycobacteriales bacterium]
MAKAAGKQAARQRFWTAATGRGGRRLDHPRRTWCAAGALLTLVLIPAAIVLLVLGAAGAALACLLLAAVLACAATWLLQTAPRQRLEP